MGGTHTTTREEALQLVQTTFLEFGDILENLNRTVMRHGVENMQPDAVQLAQQVLDYSTNCYDPNLYTNGYAKLSNDGVSELLELCRKLSRLYKLPVSSHIPDGSLAITFELIPWFITSMQQMALARLDDNVNELQQVRERLLSEATQYIEGDGSSLDAIIRANEDLEAIDYRIIENADRMVMLMGCADYEGHERVRQENKALVAQKQAITARTPLVGFIGHRGRRSINALTRDIQRACGKVASAQVKVRAKIVSGDFPVWQMTPVVMDVLSTPGLTPRDIQEITGWIERQQKWETIKDVLSFAIPVAAAITCFFVPGGASILLLAVRAGAQAVNAVVGIASGIEDFDEANTHRNMVYSQLIMPTENLVEGSVGEADMRYFLGFVSLIAGGIDALDAVQAARVVSRFKSLPLDIQKQMSKMGRNGIRLLEKTKPDDIEKLSRIVQKYDLPNNPDVTEYIFRFDSYDQANRIIDDLGVENLQNPRLGSTIDERIFNYNLQEIATERLNNAEIVKNLEKAPSSQGIYRREALQEMRNFNQSIAKIVEREGKTMEWFEKAKLTPADALSDADALIMKRIRQSIPIPTEETLMQKVIPAYYVDGIMNGNASYSKVGGFVTEAADTKTLGTFDEVYEGLRLDYTPSEFTKNPDGYGVIRFKTQDTDLIRKPFGTRMGGANNNPWPSTQNGFTASRDRKVFPEYNVVDGLKADPIEGAELYRVSSDGTETLVGVYDEDKLRFVPVGVVKK